MLANLFRSLRKYLSNADRSDLDARSHATLRATRALEWKIRAERDERNLDTLLTKTLMPNSTASISALIRESFFEK